MLSSSSFYCSRSLRALAKLSRQRQRLFATLCSTPTITQRQQQQRCQLQHQHQHQHHLQQTFRNCSKSTSRSSETETFSTPRPPKDPPDDYQPTAFYHKAFDAPEFVSCSVFRKFSSPNEKLGPDASKTGVYKNPEYYSYHRFTYAEMLTNILELREERICNDNAKCIYDYESDDEGGDAGKDESKDDAICGAKDDKKKDGKDGAKKDAAKKDDKGASSDSDKKKK